MEILPRIDQLEPITNEKSTFYECGFNKKFDDLDMKTKLQILCDIVRQSIYPNPIPNPDNDVSLLNGNCHTSSITMMNYLKELNIGKNIRYVFARKRYFDPDDITTIHAVILVDDEKGHTYQIDSSPYVGYKMGMVDDITYNKIYDEYIPITDEMLDYLYIFKKIIYDDSVSNFDVTKIDYYLKKCYDALDIKILNAYNANALKVIAKYIDNSYDKDVLLNLVTKLKPYSKKNNDKFNSYKDMVFKEISKWEEELMDLKSSGSNYKKQLELASNIIQEKKMFDSSYEEWVNLDGVLVRRSFMNPRFMYENNFNQIMIKPSAFYINKDSEIRNMFSDESNFYGEYSVDLSKATSMTGIKPMIFSHTLGEEYIRSMMGETDVILVKINAEKCARIKKYLRDNLCPDMWYKEIDWIDNEKILWHPFVTNLIHSADNPSETALHYQIGYPEHQSMTRFMYPNPCLVKK